MTDDERMDRAKRIREMREGARDDGDDESASEETESSDDGRATVDGDAGQTVDADEAAAGEQRTEDDTAATSTDEVAGDDRTETSAEADPDLDAGADADPEKQTMEELVEAAADAAEEDLDAGAVAEEVAAAQAESDDLSAPLPGTEQLEAALEGAETASDPETVTPEGADGGDGAGAGQAEAAPSPDAGAAGTTTEEETRVLEFTLDDEHYCLDIEYIEEIVKEETITRVPNTPEHVQGVVDLRGQITTILNPKVILGKENDEPGDLIVVFDSEAFEDQGHIGWVVDDVRQVSPIVESEINEPPMADAHVNGVIDRDDDEAFVIWTSPELAFESED